MASVPEKGLREAPEVSGSSSTLLSLPMDGQTATSRREKEAGKGLLIMCHTEQPMVILKWED